MLLLYDMLFSFLRVKDLERMFVKTIHHLPIQQVILSYAEFQDSSPPLLRDFSFTKKQADRARTLLLDVDIIITNNCSCQCEARTSPMQIYSRDEIF